MSHEPKQVLLAEDDEVNRMVAAHILKKAGCVVTEAETGLEALHFCQEKAFSLILMDLEMPEMGGLEATALIRDLEGRQEVPIIALTAHTYPEKVAAIWAAGMTDYVVKPLDRQKFADIAGRYLEDSQA